MFRVTILAAVLLGFAGLISADLGNTSPATGACLCVTTDSRLNIRSGAGTSNRIIATLSNGQCFKYSGSKSSANGFVWYSIDYNGQRAWAAGKYLSLGFAYQCPGGSSGSSSSSRYNGCTGAGQVTYGSIRITDSQTKAKLQQIANYFCTTLYLTSGDRFGSTSYWHSRGRAGDFGLTRFNIRTQGDAQWSALKASGLFNDQGWEVIWHGTNTCTGGPHIHVARRGPGRQTCYKREGTTSQNRCVYNCE